MANTAAYLVLPSFPNGVPGVLFVVSRMMMPASQLRLGVSPSGPAAVPMMSATRAISVQSPDDLAAEEIQTVADEG